MTNPLTLLNALRRPRLLIRAARFGMTEYRRERDLARLLHSNRLPAPGQALDTLMAQEEHLENTRVSGDASYSISRHIDLLIAMMAEARLIPAPRNGKMGV